MNEKCLAIDSDAKNADLFTKAWAKHNVKMDCVKNINKAIEKLAEFGNYIFIGINGDNVDFLPMLQTLRDATNVPILIATSNFSSETEVAALNNGANLYARFHPDEDSNIISVLTWITSLSKPRKPTSRVIFHGEFLLSVANRIVFMGGKELDLTKMEFDLMHCFMSNIGRRLSCEEIYSTVWVSKFDESCIVVVKKNIERLRKKIGDENNSIIINDWGYGYKMVAKPNTFDTGL